MASTRLPGKILLPLGNKTILENVVDRVKKAKYIDDAVVATTTEKEDDVVVNLCKDKSIKYFRGDMDDVLDRYYQTAVKFGCDNICRITSDCPLIDPTVIDLVVEKYLTGKYDYVSNSRLKATYPDGLDTEVFSFKSLERAWKEAFLKSEREHVTPYIWKNPDKFFISNVENNLDWSNYRLTIDEKKDYELLQKVFAEVSDLTTDNIITFLIKHEEIKKINENIKRDAGYAKSLNDDFN